MKPEFGKKLIFIDGGLGTMIGRTDYMPEIMAICEPERLFRIHKAYKESGADVITANTFGANRFKLKDSGHTVREVVEASVALAKKAAGEDGLVSLDIGPLGTLLKPMGTLSFDDAYEAFAEVVRAGHGADIIAIETMTDAYELKAAVLAAKENSELPVIATVSIDEKGRLLTGADIPAVVALLEGLGVDALGFNCGLGPAQFESFFPTLCENASVPIALLPNAGLPTMQNGQTAYDLSPADFAAEMRFFAENGAHILGGCCGTTPEHIRLMTGLCADIIPKPPVKKNRTVISGTGHTVAFGEMPVIIGERINPTGKKRLKAALAEGDMQYILREGIAQEKAGAAVLDVNVGMPGIDEKAMMEEAVTNLQSVIGLPLQIDTGNASAMERAVRIYNGKPLLNSVNGKQESMDAVLPIVKKYGGAVVALTLDEDGIPDSAEKRVEIAEKIIRTAASYGIDRKDIIVDALTLAVSTGADNATETLRAVKMIREKLGVHTVLGVSNISFGLPSRETINAGFFTAALENGLSAGIINPLSDGMMRAYDTYCLLHGMDTDCKHFVEKYSGDAAVPIKKEETTSLYDMILHGMKGGAYKAAKELLLEKQPMELVEEVMIPALDAVGKAFEGGKVFLPQLLSSAETVKNAFEAVKEMSRGRDEVKKGRIVLATVYGDIHDIGKNIVRLLLENYGYNVCDLGRDVLAEEIVRAATETETPMVGLSALMTTTVESMENTIAALRKAGYTGKIVVGGAVLTADYAEKIGADYYAADALETVAAAKEVIG